MFSKSYNIVFAKCFILGICLTDSKINGIPIMYQTLLGTLLGVRTVRKTDRNSTHGKLSFQRSNAGAANYALWAKFNSSAVFIGIQSHSFTLQWQS